MHSLKTPTKKGAAGRDQAARRNGLQNSKYPTRPFLSRGYREFSGRLSTGTIREVLGVILLFGNKSQKAFWPLFDATLRQYVDLRLACQSAPGQEPANASQRVFP
jgi:hypothetical protein